MLETKIQNNTPRLHLVSISMFLIPHTLMGLILILQKIYFMVILRKIWEKGVIHETF